MDIEALASLESQKRFCRELVNNVVANESFILLSGDSGSGRTVVCEQIVNETDSRMRAVFIPCHKDMALQRLRELFLQQMLPSGQFDTDINLADALQKAHIPYNHKILVVVDDIDSVVSSFYNELLALHEQFAGQGRFAFVLVCHPLWAEEKVSYYAGKAEVLAMQIPPLNIQEAMVLSRHMFALQNTMRIYNAISNKLPDALAAAKGNISQIISITEKLMKDPTTPSVSNDRGRSGGKVNAPKAKKKSSSVGIFVTIVCIIIVVACLIPIFLGGSLFGSDDESSRPAQSVVANGEGLVLNNGPEDFKGLDSDEGVLPQGVPGGIDAEAAAPKTEHSVTLSGKELEKIEGGANGSAYPRGVGGSVAQQQAPAKPAIPVLRRGDNFNHVDANAQGQITHIVAPPVVSQQELQQKLAAQQAAQQALAAQQAAQQAAAQANRQPPHNPADRAALEQAAMDKLNQDRAQAQRAAQLAAQKAAMEEADRQLAAQQAAQKKAAEQKAAQQAAAQKAAQQAAQQAASQQAAQQAAAQRPAQPAQPAQPARPPLRAGQVISLADEQRQQAAARQPAAAAPVHNGNGTEATIDQLRNLPDGRYTVQIVSGSNRANVAAAARGLSGHYWIVPSSRNGRPWFILMAGDFGSREEAMAAARNIPRTVSQGATPFAKRVSDAKAEIRQ